MGHVDGKREKQWIPGVWGYSVAQNLSGSFGPSRISEFSEILNMLIVKPLGPLLMESHHYELLMILFL